MDNILKLLIIPWLLYGASGYSNHGSYLITVPKDLLPGSILDVNVIIFNSSTGVNIDALLNIPSSKSVIGHVNGSFRAGPSKDLKIQIPWTLQYGTYKLTLTATGGLSFTKETTFNHKERRVITLIQTDKAIYSNGQRVQFRVVALHPDLRPYEGPLDIAIYDDKKSLSQRWTGVSGKLGIISKFYELGPNPVYGDWTIDTHVKGVRIEEKSFKVHKYVLPKYDVTINTVSRYLIGSGGPINVNVTARYSYGKDVQGTLKFQAQSLDGKVLMQTFTNIHGSLNVTIPQSKYHDQLLGIVIIVQVGESTSGTTVTTEKTIEFISWSSKSQTPSISMFLEPNLQKFAPGLPYVTFVKILNGSGSYKVVDNTLWLDVTFTKHVTRMCRYTNAPYTLIITETINQHDIYVRSGYAKIQLQPDINTINIDLKISFASLSQTFTLRPKQSKSGNQIKIIPNQPYLEVDSTTHIEVASNFNMNKPIYYQIFSRGGIPIQNHRFNCHGQKCLSHALQVQSLFFPLASIVIYYVTDASEIMFDEIILDVKHFHLSPVKLQFSKQQVLPGENITLNVQSLANSSVCLLAVDKSVLILQNGFDITEHEVERKIFVSRKYIEEENLHLFHNIGLTAITDYVPSYTSNVKHIPNECNPCSSTPCRNGGTCTYFWTDYQCSCTYTFTGKNCDVFYSRLPTSWPGFDNYVLHNMMHNYGSLIHMPAPSNTIVPLARQHKSRTRFLETWVWQCIDVGETGKAVLPLIAPDTITSWVATAFASNEKNGLGLTDKQETLTVFTKIFLEVFMPLRIKDGEIPVVKIGIYNYDTVHRGIMVRSYHTNNRNDMFTTSVSVDPGHSAVRYNSLRLSGTGIFNFTVMAIDDFTFQPIDSVTKVFVVEPKGVEQEYHTAIAINLTKRNNIVKTQSITLPYISVPSTKKVSVSVTGNAMAPMIQGLQNLLRLPNYCGEQTMINLAPDVFALDYLTAINQLSDDIKDKSIEYIIKGRDREMNLFRHRDGSFSAFGNKDSSGSIWLTAFIVMTFHQANKHVSISRSALDDALHWIIKFQNNDGSFRNIGRIIHTNMQGGTTSSKLTLASYIAIALKENDDASNQREITLAMQKAKQFIENIIQSETRGYSLALASYALKVLGSSKAGIAFSKLQNLAHHQGDLTFWNDNANSRIGQVKTIDIETAAYALLYYSHEGNITEGMPIFKWLAAQRNGNGGFVSTQDTVIALRAMTKFSILKTIPSDISVDLSVRGKHTQLSLDNGNKLNVQSLKFPDDTDSVTISATGQGMCIVNIAVKYYVQAVEDAAYQVRTNVTTETFDSITVKICSRRLINGQSGMAIKEIDIPSGYKPDMFTTGSSNVVKHKETDKNKVVLYLDSIGQSDTCVIFKADRVDKVAQSQTYSVNVYDYYEPANQGFGNYTSLLRDNLGLCDLNVCPQCDVCHPTMVG